LTLPAQEIITTLNHAARRHQEAKESNNFRDWSDNVNEMKPDEKTTYIVFTSCDALLSVALLSQLPSCSPQTMTPLKQ
jgi:hypothetical protein